MKNLRITWKGLTPLIMHSCQCANPLHPIAKEMKKYTSKRKKTDEDLIKISDLEWEAGAYWKEGLGLYIPAENVEATILNGAKANKKGKDFEKYCTVTDIYIPLDYGENLTKEELISNYKYDESKIDLETITLAIENAGLYVGLCDSRPKYGKFTAIIEELD